jgi:5-methylthioadenosine/S-adenosylhomocysteine deaminase
MTKPWALLAILALSFQMSLKANAAETTYVLEGTLVTPAEVIENGKLVVVGDKIAAVGREIPLPPGAPVINTEGLIFPGLVDLHNHLTWNVFPRWKPNRLFDDRYAWQESADYERALQGPENSLIKKGLGCDADRFAEVKALAGGATSVVGSLKASPDHPNDNACIEGLARNLDFYSGLYEKGVLNSEKVLYLVFPLDTNFEDLEKYRKELAEGSLECILIHLAEGKDASARYEFRILKAQGLLRRGVIIIHGTALTKAQFTEMAEKGVGLIWSPRSNIELYGVTTSVRLAKLSQVTIALAPDWSPSGSDGMLEELHYAANWNDREKVFDDGELVRMVTSIPAKLAGLGDRIGTLSPGLSADLLVIRGDGKAPYRSLLEAGPEGVRLVIVGGTPLYGEPELVRRVLPNQSFSSLRVCGKEMALNFDQPTGDSWDQTIRNLEENLRQSDTRLAPLADPSSCVP